MVDARQPLEVVGLPILYSDLPPQLVLHMVEVLLRVILGDVLERPGIFLAHQLLVNCERGDTVIWYVDGEVRVRHAMLIREFVAVEFIHVQDGDLLRVGNWPERGGVVMYLGVINEASDPFIDYQGHLEVHHLVLPGDLEYSFEHECQIEEVGFDLVMAAPVLVPVEVIHI